jgi:dihydrofolate synthase / folylpolyglutamate synthase
MIIRGVQTSKITAGSMTTFELLEQYITSLKEGDVVAITSKIISLCENRVIPFEKTDKETLVIQESDKYLPHTLSKYGHHFTITNNTLIPMAGVDESNGNNNYVLWPRDAQKSANDIRKYLKDRFGLQQVGVLITDSTCRPLRRGTTGIDLAHSGFVALNNYVGSPDLFGRPFGVSQASVSGGLAAAAVLVMGEGIEQTPICVMSDLSFVQFQDRNPSAVELEMQHISLEDDLFAPFLQSVNWQKGMRKQQDTDE